MPASWKARATPPGSAACASRRRYSGGGTAKRAPSRAPTAHARVASDSLTRHPGARHARCDRLHLLVGHDVRRHDINRSPIGRSRSPRPAPREAPAREVRRAPFATSQAKIMPHWRKLRTRGCAATGARQRAQLAGAAAVVRDHVLVAEHVEHRQRRRAGERIAGVRMRVEEAARHVVGVERGVDRVGRRARTKAAGSRR